MDSQVLKHLNFPEWGWDEWEQCYSGESAWGEEGWGESSAVNWGEGERSDTTALISEVEDPTGAENNMHSRPPTPPASGSAKSTGAGAKLHPV